MALSRRRSALVRRLRRRGTREREGLFLVEGIRSAAEALRGGAEVRFAVCSPRLRTLDGGDEVVRILERAGIDASWVDDAVLEDLSDTETPQGVLLACGEPSWGLDDMIPGGGRGLLLLDGVQDPGNLGTLVRAAAAFGLAGVVALDGTVDPWNPKAVRAAAGTLFHIPVAALPWKQVAPRLHDGGVRLVVADAGGRDVAEWPVPEAWALAVGNEGRGVRPEVVSAATAAVAVPMAGGAGSLNAGVAGAILLYVLTRGRTVPPPPEGDPTDG